MIERITISEIVHDYCAGTPLFLVDVKTSSDNRIYVFIDGDQGVKIEDCITLSKFIEEKLDREKEDFELTVSSCGLEHPLKLNRQYKKNIGQEVSVLTIDGEKVIGELVEVDTEFLILEPQQSRRKNKQKEDAEPTTLKILFTDIKETKVMLSF